MVDKIDKVQLPTHKYPGAGAYNVQEKPVPKHQAYTSNLMSGTQKKLQGQRLHSVNYPSATAYDASNYDTIENPVITGGAPNNILKLVEYEKKVKAKRMNPFATNDKSFQRRMETITGHLGPGRYSPQTREDIGGSEFMKSKAKMFSTLTAKSSKQGARVKTQITKGDQMNSSGGSTFSEELTGDAFQTLGAGSFGSQTERFRNMNHELAKQLKLPGPGNYYSFGAGNYSPQARAANNHAFNESRLLDEQWNNKSVSIKFAQQTNHLQGVNNMPSPAHLLYKGKHKTSNQTVIVSRQGSPAHY